MQDGAKARDKVVVELSALVVMLAGQAVWTGQDHATDQDPSTSAPILTLVHGG